MEIPFSHQLIAKHNHLVYDGTMTSTPWRYIIVNSFGALGYISVIIQWTWSFITLGQPLITADRPLFLPQAPIPPVSHAIDFGVFTPFVSLIALFVTVLIIIFTIITIFRLPKTIGEKGSDITHVVATKIVKTTHRRHPLPVKKTIRLSFWIVCLLKVAAICTPFLLIFITPAIQGLTTQLIFAVGVICALFSLFYFVLQLVLALILRLDKKKVW